MPYTLKLLVIHCTATPAGREVSVEEIRRWHTAPPNEGGRGWKQVGYTDMVHLDGTVERLVANNEDDVVDPWEITNGAKGYNRTARHIVYVGGVERDGKTPRDTRTSEQRGALAAIVAGVPVIVEAIRGFWKSMPGWVSMALNWVLGVGICMFGWWQDLGFLADLDWQIALMYGIGAGIAASGFAETGLIQWLISLFTRKKKKGA